MNHRDDAQRIAGEIEQVLRHAPDSPPEIQACLARYVCVLASGYLETSLRAEILTYVESRVHDYRVVKFVETGLKRLGNPSSDYILELVGRFGNDLRHRLDDNLDLREKSAVDSIRTNRNQIAHGGSSGLSLSFVRQYYKDSVTVVEKIKEVLSHSDTFVAPEVSKDT